MNLDWNDPRLTAYALDELSPAERLQFETELGQIPGTQRAVAEILETAGSLRIGFAAEEAAMSATSLEKKVIRPAFWQRSGVRAGMVAAVGVAACFAVVLVAVRDSRKAEEIAARSRDADPFEEQTTGEFRITIQHPEKTPKRTQPSIAAAPLRPVATSEIIPQGKIAVPSAARLPEPETHFVSTLDPLPEHLRNLRFIDPLDRKVSTFALEVATASFGEIQRSLNAGSLPRPDQIRVEELVNAFEYADPAPESASQPFRLHLEVADCPWRPENRLVRIGLKTRESSAGEPVALNPAIQVDFNPWRVAGYRLIGEPEPSGDSPGFDRPVQPGFAITAFYEIIPVAETSAAPFQPIIPQESGRMASLPPQRRLPVHPELLTVHLHYQQPAGGAEKSLSTELIDLGTPLSQASADFRFAAAAAAFGGRLLHPGETQDFGFAQVAEMAESALGEDRDGRRREFVDLVRKASEIR